MSRNQQIYKSSPPSANTRDGVLYARVSSKKQVTDGHGIDSQLRRGRQYADQNGIRIVAEFKDEGISGKDSDRPQVKAMIDFIQNHPNEVVVIMDEVNRMARENIAYYLLKQAIEAAGGKIEYVSQKFDDSAEGAFIESIIVQVGAYERIHNAHRTINRMEIHALDAKIDACVTELVATKEAVVKSAINKQIAEHSRRREILEKRISEARDAKDDFGAVLSKVMGIVYQPDIVWENADLPMKQIIQRLVFPKPLIYEQEAGKFRNPEKALVYRLFEENAAEKHLMARPKRFELLTF
ncbi:MAG: recombinase family protein [Proteobacteria bacterium]|nr:recombinase family protein [Pseudomonadota bacterium]